jgi:hypothetical protein
MSTQTLRSIIISALIALSLASAYVIVERNNASMHGTVTEAPSGFMH